MDFDEYQEKALETAIYDDPFYPFASLMIEAAEFVDVVTKPLLRGDDVPLNVQAESLLFEAGDVLWNLACCLDQYGIRLSDVANYNIKKLQSRKARGVLQGSGGDR